jgi:hypothetical protein
MNERLTSSGNYMQEDNVVLEGVSIRPQTFHGRTL